MIINFTKSPLSIRSPRPGLAIGALSLLVAAVLLSVGCNRYERVIDQPPAYLDPVGPGETADPGLLDEPLEGPAMRSPEASTSTGEAEPVDRGVSEEVRGWFADDGDADQAETMRRPPGGAAEAREADMPRGTAVSPEAEATRIHVVQEGETLWALSRRYYGRGVLWPRIADANGFDDGRPIVLQPGQRLIIPELDR